MQDIRIMGYRRENGRVGIRNHVVVLPLDDLSNAAAEAVAKIVTGSMAIPHGYGHARAGVRLDTAKNHAGVSINDLTDPALVDELTGNAAFSDTKVRVRAA